MFVLLLRFLLSSTYFSHVASLLTCVTLFILVFAARGIMVSTLTLFRLLSHLGPGMFPPVSITFFEAISVAVAISTALLNVSSRSANSCRWMRSLLIPQTSQSCSMSLSVAPIWQCSENLLSPATNSATFSPSRWLLLWNLNRSTITLGFREKWLSSFSKISFKPASPGFRGCNKSRTNLYVLLPQTLNRMALCFFSSLISFATKYCPQTEKVGSWWQYLATLPRLIL